MIGNPEVPHGVAERRQLTVLFCDLVGSTRLSEQLDPEDFGDLIRNYQNAVAGVVERYDGHIAQYLGDGLLVYFGHPVAHDDDAERAVRCAYDALRAVRELKGQALSARIGVHTGTVVVGQVGAGGRHETLAMGEATNLAAKLQAAAEPDTVVISHSTHKLVPGLFIIRDLGVRALKGVDKPVQVFQIVQPSGVRTRLEAAERLTPFVGRAQEMALLVERWEQAREGQGQAVLLSAEPGIGKSRLLLKFRERIRDTTHTWLDCRASPLSTGSSYQPVIELMHRGLALKDGDSDRLKLEKLEQSMDLIGQDRAEAVPLLAPLLNLPLSPPYAPSPDAPELRRRKTMALLNTWLLALAASQPLVLAFEDLHWADPATVELTTLLLEQIPTHRVLVIHTARPEFQPGWPVRAHTLVLSLAPLRARDSAEMLDRLTQGKALPEAVRERVLNQSGGVPLFLEEITKALLESGQLAEKDGRLVLTRALENLAIPATLQDSLMARLDRLGAAKATAQVCSVIGREVPYRLLRGVSAVEETALLQHLQVLGDAQLLYPRGTPPQASYLFKHALIQDAAYESLLKSTRQKLHGQIAQALERDFSELARNEPEVLAQHFEKAQQFEQAVEYYRRAGQRAATASVMRAAAEYADRALRLLEQLPAATARDALRLALLNDQIQAHYVVSGYAHARVRELARRAGALLKDEHDPVTQVGLLGALWVTHHGTAEFEAALGYAARIAALGQRLKVPIFEAGGHAWAAGTLVMMGRFVEAREAAARAVMFDDPAGSKLMATQAGMDPVTMGYLAGAWALYALGYPDQAEAQVSAGLRQADRVDVPSNSWTAMGLAALSLWLNRCAPERLMSASQSALAVCRKHGHVQGEVWAGRALGAAKCQAGMAEEGLELIRQGNRIGVESGWDGDAPLNRYGLAEQCLAHGRLAEARTAIDEALSGSVASGAHWFLAEMHRIDGELLLAEGAPTERAEAAFRQGLEVARSQRARSFELRAATSLARLWQGQDRVAEARALLKPVYAGFTEGFDTRDLKDANALLGALGDP